MCLFAFTSRSFNIMLTPVINLVYDLFLNICKRLRLNLQINLINSFSQPNRPFSDNTRQSTFNSSSAQKNISYIHITFTAHSTIWNRNLGILIISRFCYWVWIAVYETVQQAFYFSPLITIISYDNNKII